MTETDPTPAEVSRDLRAGKLPWLPPGWFSRYWYDLLAGEYDEDEMLEVERESFWGQERRKPNV